MSDYTQIEDYSAKDALASGDPEKVISGADIDAELAAISTAIASKANDSAVMHLAGAETVTGAKTFGALVTLKKGADIASATTVDLTAATGNLVHITGTTTTTGFTMNSGQVMFLVADAAWPLTYHATNLRINGGASYTCAAGDRLTVWYDGTTTYVSVIPQGVLPVAEATAAEIKTGSEPAKYVSPDKLLDAVGFTARYNSGNQTITSGGSLTLAHGLGREPILVVCWWKCLTAENNYSVGDKILANPCNSDSGNDSRRFALKSDSTNITIRFGSAAIVIPIQDFSTGTGVGNTNANWALIVEAFA